MNTETTKNTKIEIFKAFETNKSHLILGGSRLGETEADPDLE
ncbi:hypothetical protein [uncultured Lacinutrix sp.]|nr:hypothetical protein [uncultured Lacinutrix sp.]